MRKLIAAMNMTLDGFCNHTAMIADDEIHQHYNELLSNAGTLIYGRITYQLMESYWPLVVKDPTGNKPVDEFAVLIDNLSKIVFSRTLKSVEWKNTTLKKEIIKDEVLALKQQAGKNILVGSPGLIVALTCQLSDLDNVSIDDYNFDGLTDFSVFEQSYAGPNTSSLYFLFNPKTGKYFKSSFEGTSLEFGQKTKRIYEHNQCCAGRSHMNAEYKVVNNKMVLVKKTCLEYDEKTDDYKKVKCE